MSEQPQQRPDDIPAQLPGQLSRGVSIQAAVQPVVRPRPAVVVNQDQGLVIAETRKALAEVNQPPELFRCGGLLSRTGLDDEDRVIIVPLTPPAIRAELGARIQWVKIHADGTASPAGVPPIAVDDLSTHADELGGEHGIPVLDQVVTAPVFGPEGTLVTEPGYISSARVWYEPVDGMKVPPVNQHPSRAEITHAINHLVCEYLGDFPFDSEASRQHALGALLLPFVRLMIDGPVPLQCVDSSTPGTGKTLLQQALMFPALGGMLPALPGVLGDEEELRKKITTALMRGQQMVRWDNVTARVDSATLSAVLTASIWEDRMLGLNRNVTVPVRAVFMMNGNNLSFSQEIARRAVPSRLDVAKVGGGPVLAEEPWRRTGFRHPDLIGWAKEHRGELVWDALTLTQGWIAAGKPAGRRVIGSYERWGELIGGIIEHAAIDQWGRSLPGFLTGLDDLYADAVSERDEKITFLETWYGRFGEREVSTQDLITNLADVDPFEITGRGTERSQQTRFGTLLGRMRDQVWGGYQVVKRGRAWSVRKLGGDDATMQP
jgi:hypothetical protein